MRPVRTRFAPSPTGYMHVGNLRTALYAYLIARQAGGAFLLRIEDTDQGRYVEGAVDVIYKTLRDVGLQWDEGPDVGGAFGPYVQSERRAIYQKHAEELVQKGGAYYCFCSKEELDEQREIQKAKGELPKYSGRCRNLSPHEVAFKLAAGEPYVIRQKMPVTGSTSFHDEVFGDITVENDTLDDQVLLKADGLPTYNFANVVDDHLMEITHVVRGNEYLSSTPKYNLLYDAFGWEKPIYVHCSMVMKNATEKLAKRHGDASYQDLIDKGYVKGAILNYIALCGWSPGGDREMFSLPEMIEAFSIAGISKSPSIFDSDKLKYMSGEYIRAMSPDDFQALALPYVRQAVQREDVDLALLCEVLQKRTELLAAIPEQVDFLEALPSYPVDLYVNYKMRTDAASARAMLLEVRPVLANLPDFTQQSVHGAMMELVLKLGVKNGYLLWPLRVALSGKAFTPGGGIEIAAILGREEALRRIDAALIKLAGVS